MLRVYGRTTDVLTGKKTWEVVTTDRQGFNDHVMLTALAEVLLLNLNESPFYGNYGIPAKNSVLSQVAPDFNVSFTQQQYANYFAVLLIAKRNLPVNSPEIIYDVQVVTHAGVKLNKQVPIPT